MRLALAILGVTFVAAAPALAQSLGSFDRDFVADAAARCRNQVALAQLAEVRGRSAAVKQFAARSAHDYAFVQSQLELLAKQKGLDLPPPARGVPSAAVVELGTLAGAAFDDGYMAAMQREHDGAVHAFEHEVQTGDDGDWRAWAARVLDRLQRDDLQAHLYVPQR